MVVTNRPIESSLHCRRIQDIRKSMAAEEKTFAKKN